MMNKVILFCLLFSYNLCIVLSDFHYPKVRRDDTISDNYFNTTVKDPYRWLEDPDSTETKKFVNDENVVTNSYLEKNKYRKQISENFKDIYNYPKYGVPFKGGSKYYFWQNSGLQNQNVYYSMDSIDSNETKVFLDPNLLNSNGTSALDFISFSKDGKYCAYGISENGSDWAYIKIKNAKTLEDLPETLTKVKFSTAAWTHDNQGFFYSQFDEYNGTGHDPVSPKNEKVFYHRLNTNQSEDIKIAAFPKHPVWIIIDLLVSDDGKYVHIFPQEGMVYAWFYAKLDSLPIKSGLDLNAVIEVPDANYYYVTSDDNIVYMRTNKNAANYRFVKIDLNKPQVSNWVNILDEDKSSVLINAVAVNNNNLAAVYMKDVSHVLQIHDLSDGKSVLNLSFGSSKEMVGSLSAQRKDNKLFYNTASFLNPGTIYMLEFQPGNKFDVKVLKKSYVKGLNPDEFETNQVFFPSKDKTVKIPMFLVHKKGIKFDGSNPTLLYAYGGFDANSLPEYDAMATFFFKNLHGVYALANIRGGGEYGESWHKAGMKTNKQNVFDDFASAAEYLIANNYTRRDRLTIKGDSNGGLLVGASANQRPDLFGCALAGVGVMDMIRFPLFTVGFVWRGEYGNPQNNRTEFEYIYRYSPLHSIPKDAKEYPAILITTADHDDRVVPAHSFKFAATLQYLLGSKLADTPLMIRIDTNSGHGAGKPISKWINEFTDEVSFVINSLKLEYLFLN